MYLPQTLSFFKSVCLRLRTDLTNQSVLFNKLVCFTHANVLLSYVNETIYLPGNLPFFKIHVNHFMAQENTLSQCYVKMYFVDEEPQVILQPKKIKPVTVTIFTPSICHEVMGSDEMILVF